MRPPLEIPPPFQLDNQGANALGRAYSDEGLRILRLRLVDWAVTESHSHAKRSGGILMVGKGRESG